jgi:hypothetical protein
LTNSSILSEWKGEKTTLITWLEINKLWYLSVIALFFKGKKDSVSEFDTTEGIRGNQKEICSALENWVV